MGLRCQTPRGTLPLGPAGGLPSVPRTACPTPVHQSRSTFLLVPTPLAKSPVDGHTGKRPTVCQLFTVNDAFTTSIISLRSFFPPTVNIRSEWWMPEINSQHRKCYVQYCVRQLQWTIIYVHSDGQYHESFLVVKISKNFNFTKMFGWKFI